VLNELCHTISVGEPGLESASHAADPADRAAEIAAAWARERPDLPVASIGILTRIWQVAKLASDDRRRTLAELGMDAATLDLLSTLRRAGPPYRVSTRELTARSLVTAGAITQRVDRAQRSGLVRRLPSARGSRVVLVELTPDGHAAVEAAVAAVLRHEQQVVDVLDPVHQEQLAEMLAVLLRGFEQMA
jgi:DNA-binding MarR family transcriptional regulator